MLHQHILDTIETEPNTSLDHVSWVFLKTFGATGDHCDLQFCGSFQKQEASLPCSKTAATKKTLAIYDDP
jgi:hypothetical protein